ncbi:M56 family metallopeptidase [Dyadobacter sp. 32]|uniref:M56 family metallopeptidase n=1 Tax=Dyadobacter sp. 32 TaxID=538966 RepID=UPI0011EF55A8
MLFPYLFKVSFLLAILTVSYRWLIQYETFSKINRVLLLFNMAAAWSLPLIPLPDWGPVNVQTEFHQTIPKLAKAAPDIAREIGPRGTPNALDPISHSSEVDWVALFYLIYWLGATVMIVRLLYQLREIVIKLLSIPSKLYTKGVRLIQDPKTISPFSFFCWIIYNPERHSDLELQHILAHESEHVSQKHSIDLLFVELQKIMLWFNPFAWVHQKLVQENLEYLVDQSVLRDGFEKKQYQLSLLKVVMRTSELPLTNSFAQSLLKKRIKMMNRKPSKLWVLGKYTLLIVLLYMSSAFVAPYKKQLIALAPAITKSFATSVLPESTKPSKPVADDVNLKAVVNLNDAAHLPKLLTGEKFEDNDPQTPTTKGILISNDTLYWAISPLTTWDDINRMKQVIKNFGCEFNITSMKLDPLNLFLTSVSVDAKAPGATGEASSTDMEKEEVFKPMRICSGFLWQHGLGMGQLPPAALLASVESDYQRALALAKENEVAFGELGIMRSVGRSSSTEFPKQSLEKGNGDSFFIKTGIGKSPGNTVMIGEKLRNADFFLNAKPISLDEVNSLNIDRLISAKIVGNTEGKYYVLLRAK